MQKKRVILYVGIILAFAEMCIRDRMEGVTIDSMETLQDQLSYYAVGETVELTVQVPASGGEYEEQTVSVTLGANPN